jgi:hypothetical protein
MSQGMLKGIIALFVFVLLCPALSFAFNAHKPFDISADVITYIDASQEMTAEGHVVVVQGTSTLSADYLRYDSAGAHMEARGHVIAREKGALMAGDQMDYDLNAETGTVIQGKTYASPWLVQSVSWEKEKDYYVGRYTALTNCELIDPHYHIRSSRVHFIPNDIFWAWNNVFYIDDKPVFYSPFLFRDLEKQRVVVQIQPGNDSVNGTFAKTATTVRFTDHVYDRFLFDHYNLAGNGVGNEFDFQNPGKIKGSLFGYYINPRTDPSLTGALNSPQFNIRSYLWDKVNATTFLQSNVNYRKNVSFNNVFFNQDTNQAVNDINNSMALTKTTKRWIQRLVVESQDGPDPGDTSIFANVHSQNASLPRYDFTLSQIPLWSPHVDTSTSTLKQNAQHLGALQWTMNGSIGNSYARQDDLVRQKGNWSGTLSQSIPISRKWSFTPSLTPSLNWQDQYDPLPTFVQGVGNSTAPITSSTSTVIPLGFFKGFQSRIGTSNLLRWKPTSTLSVDNTYALTERMEANGTSLDRALPDGGIETHHVTTLAFWRPSRSILLRSFSGYDLRKIADEDPNAYRQRRVDPWTTEMTILPQQSAFDYFFRYELGYFPTRGELWEGDVDYKGIHKTIFTTGFLYNNGTPGELTWNNSVGLYLSPGWRVDVQAHALVPNGGYVASQQARLTDVLFTVTRDLHCWQAQFIYKDSVNLSKEVSLLFNLKIDAQTPKKPIHDNELETQFYPWRADPTSPQEQRAP